MTTIAGALSARFLQGTPSIISPDLGKYSAPYAAAAAFMALGIFGAKSANTSGSAQPRRVLSGAVARQAGDEIFEKIIVVPRTKNVGAIFADTSFQVEVWNSFRRLSKSLTAINITGSGGLAVANPGGLPLLFGPFQSRFFTASVPKDGTSVIAAAATFVFSGITGTDIQVTGTRGIFLAGAANWRERLTETYSYHTGIIGPAVDGFEQRQRFIRAPRRRYQYLITSRVAQEAALIRSVIEGAQVKVILLPEWTEQQPLTAQLSAGASVINIGTADYDLTDGGKAVLYSSFGSFEIVEILNVIPGVVTLTRGVDNTWPIGTMMVPCRRATLDQTLTFAQLTSKLMEFQIAADVDPSDSPKFAAGYTYPYTYKSYNVFMEHNNDTETLTPKYARNTTTMDNEIGLRQLKQWAGFPFLDFTYLMTLKGRARVTTIRKFIEDCSGHFRPFWLPSWQQDFEMATSFASGSTSIVVKERGYARYVGVNTALRDLVLIKPDLTATFHRIIDAVSNGNGTETLTMDAVMGYNAVPSDFLMLSFLHFCRLDSDSFSLDWLSGNVATLHLPMRLLAAPG